MPPTALLYDPDTKTWLQFDQLLQVYTTNDLIEVPKLLATIEADVEKRSLYAVGFVSYEASRAFEPTAATIAPNDFPLLWFGLFESPKIVAPPVADAEPTATDWKPALDENEFCRAIDKIKTAIGNGETYQVNFTFPLTAPYTDDPWSLFCRLIRNQPDSYGAWIDTGSYAIASASPELFFDRCDKRLTSKPMKGTTTRGRTLTEDRDKADALQASPKERAENIMVLDMIRNDLARLPGGPVKVEELCVIEKHPTVWQMTSTAATVTEATIADIFATLFPCASITGAPKIRTMHHIAALETTPRDIYTGAIGMIAPNKMARFSVAIRTALIDRESKTATYGIGSGITWDSIASAEYSECLNKADILHKTRPPFALLESLLWEPESGYYLLEEHLLRLQHSAEYFNYPYNREELQGRLRQQTLNLPVGPHKVRLLLEASGTILLEAASIAPARSTDFLRVRLAKAPIETNDPFLYHKTTIRNTYETARQSVADCDEVLLYNERNEVTEASNSNIVVKVEGKLLTPPVSSGLLAGTLRSQLLSAGEIREQIIKVDDLPRCTELFLINSVRRWRQAKLINS